MTEEKKPLLTEAHMFEFGVGHLPDIFIQWKGTEVCGDFHCECGGYAHLCGETFMYQIRCSKCGVVWEVPNTLPLRRSSDQSPTGCCIDAKNEIGDDP